MANFLEQLDSQLGALFAEWNVYTTAIAAGIAAFIAYGIYTHRDADTHPLILSRQSSANYVRNKGESALYRSPDVPHGYPLRTGLGVKETGAPAYSSGKNGDLRDIWRRVSGELPLEIQGAPGAGRVSRTGAGQPKILTVMGRVEIIDHNVAEVTKEIVVIGDILKKHGKRVALYLPNSIEFLAALFGKSARPANELLLLIPPSVRLLWPQCHPRPVQSGSR
jgi:hypothetical protein